MPARKKATDGPKPTTQRKASRARAAGDGEAAVTRAPRRRAASATGGSKPARSGKNLVIVESPTKAKTIQKYLGPDFEVAASYGHVRDLPPKPRGSDIGIDIAAGWVPTYVIAEDKKKAVLADLKRRSDRAGMVYLAPDPDREGEAIAWHLKEALKLDDDRIRRVFFNEITKKAVQEAFEHPTEIDMDRVRAQEARRFLDRAVGYKISPLLRKKIARGLSAGRVQSVAVRLIVEREREIEAFKAEEYWKVTAHLSPATSAAPPVTLRVLKKSQDGSQSPDQMAEHPAPAADHDEESPAHEPPVMKATSGKTFLAELAEWDGKKFECSSEDQATTIGQALQSAEYVVARVEQKDRAEKAPPPFTTSTLQQQANIRFGYSARHTMALAQQLYEGVELGAEGSVALITYMRTDSTRVSEEALRSCRELIGNKYGVSYLPETPNRFAASKGAQEAHEAVRPTDLSYTPERVHSYLNEHQRKLYELIYRRFVASQMKPAIFAITNVDIRADKGLLKSQGKILKFDGYRRVLAPRGRQEDLTLPHLDEQQELSLLDLVASQHFTQPPPRYKEASLVKALEKEGIGRPSTYATIIHKIQERKYVEQRERRFWATELGKLVTDQLVKHFPTIMDVKFTSRMEEELDEIEERKIEWRKVLDDFWGPFSEALEKAKHEMQAAKNEETGDICPECGKALVWRYSTKSKGMRFAGCSGYPECKYIKRGEGEEARPAPEETDIPCPACGKMMLKRTGDRGPFLGCSGYPECRQTMNLDAEGKPVPGAQPTEHVCEKCGKPMVLRQGQRGPFLGCSGYPKCRNLIEVDDNGNPVKPIETGVQCEKCGKPMHVKRGPRGPFLGCSGFPKCRSTKQMPAELKEKLKDQLPAPRAKAALPKVEIHETCPECGAALELRRGRRGYFLGCSQFAKTRCKGSKEVPPEVMEQLHATPVGSGQ